MGDMDNGAGGIAGDSKLLAEIAAAQKMYAEKEAQIRAEQSGVRPSPRALRDAAIADAKRDGFDQAIEGDKRYPDSFTRLRESELGAAASGRVAGALAGVGGQGATQALVDRGLLAKPPTPPLPADPEGVKQDPERDASGDATGGDPLPSGPSGGARAAVVTGTPFARQRELGHDMKEAREHMERAAHQKRLAVFLEQRALEDKASQVSLAAEWDQRRKEIHESAVARAEARREARMEAFSRKVEAARSVPDPMVSGAGAFAAALGVGLGAWAASMRGGPNHALAAYNSIRDAQIQEQKLKAAEQENEYSRMRQVFGDERQAELAMKMRIDEKARDHYAKIEAASKSDFARAKAAELRSHLEEGLADNAAKMQMIEDGKTQESEQPTYVLGRDGQYHQVPAARPEGWDAAKQQPEGAPVQAAMPGSPTDKEVAGDAIKVADVTIDGSVQYTEADEKAAAARARAAGNDTKALMNDGVYDDKKLDAYLAQETKPLRDAEAAKRAPAPAQGQRPIKSFTRDAAPAPVIPANADATTASAMASKLRERAQSSGEAAVYAKILQATAAGKWKNGLSLMHDQGKTGKLEDIVNKDGPLLRKMAHAQELAQAAEALKRAAPQVTPDMMSTWEAANKSHQEALSQGAAGRKIVGPLIARDRDSIVSDLSPEAKKQFERVMALRADFIREWGGKALNEGEKANLNSAFGGLAGLSAGIDGIVSSAKSTYNVDRTVWRIRVETLPLLDLLRLYRQVGPNGVNPPEFDKAARATVAPR